MSCKRTRKKRDEMPRMRSASPGRIRPETSFPELPFEAPGRMRSLASILPFVIDEVVGGKSASLPEGIDGNRERTGSPVEPIRQSELVRNGRC